VAALTADLIVDRIRSIVVSAPFEFQEAVSWATFDLQPTTNIDAVFRVPPPQSGSVVGGFGYTDDRTDTFEIWIARKRNSDWDGVRRTLLRDVQSITAAVTRDGSVSSGDYLVFDDGRGYEFGTEAGAEFVTATITLPINYDSQL
jgi:hypothetical protein